MRTILNISVPTETASEIKREMKRGGFSSTSEFFRHLIREWKRHQLLKDIEESRREFAQGKGKLLRSLKDLR